MASSRTLVPIASSGGVTLFAPTRSFVSFTNSPYYSHEHGSAVDIYPLLADATALSPVQGQLVEEFTVRSPRPKYFQAVEWEKVLIIRPEENPSLVVRILHTDYNAGSEVKLFLGTPLGNMVRSGFFNFWTEHHIHVEVRPIKNLLRAKGSLPMVPSTQSSKLLGTVSEHPPKLRIVSVNQNYILVEPMEGGIMTLDPFMGVGCKIGKTFGILDAGIPHYNLGSVQVERGVAVSLGDKVSLWGAPIGKVVACRNGLATFKSLSTIMRVNTEIIHGLSLYLWIGKRPLIKLIPSRAAPPKLRKGEEVTVHIRTINATT